MGASVHRGHVSFCYLYLTACIVPKRGLVATRFGNTGEKRIGQMGRIAADSVPTASQDFRLADVVVARENGR